jgi:hypothetical protein
MRNVALILSIFITLFVLSSMVQAETTLVTYNSPKSISQAMDLAIRSNSLNYLYTQEPSRVDSIYKVDTRPDSLKLKNPNTALLIAVVPGVVVHGAGHFYARKPLTGLVLLTAEVAGLIFWLRGHLIASGWSSSKESMEGDVIIGMGLFFGSWIYDIVRAPKIIEEHNERLLYKAKFN